jgi:hypothetical protein
MENPICDFEVIQNPNRKYANTVNLVFFRAYPIYKNFQKYIDGLKNWSAFMKYYPYSQLQIFVDRTIATDPAISKILASMNARVYLFDCPEYKEDDHHIGLFPTMMRFYPIFDINTHAMNIAHVQELEPDKEFVERFGQMDVASRSKSIQNNNVALIYGARNFYETLNWDNKSTFEDGISYPWCVAGRFTMTEKVPFKLWTDFLKKIDSGESFVNKYLNTQANKIKPEHGNYHFGVDEAFLNDTLMPWLIDHKYGIGIVSEYNIAYPIYYLEDKIRRNKRSKEILDYILQTNNSVERNLRLFDSTFYKKTDSKTSQAIVDRFYEIVEKYPDWLGRANSSLIIKAFKGYVYRKCMIVTRNSKIVDIVDLD